MVAEDLPNIDRRRTPWRHGVGTCAATIPDRGEGLLASSLRQHDESDVLYIDPPVASSRE